MTSRWDEYYKAISIASAAHHKLRQKSRRDMVVGKISYEEGRDRAFRLDKAFLNRQLHISKYYGY